MAELARRLGRATLEYDELPPSLRDDPLQVLAFEKKLTEYLGCRYLADNAQAGLESNPDMNNNAKFQEVLTAQQARANQKLAELQDEYRFTPSQAQTEKWVTSTVFSDEVNWTDIDTYLTEHYTQLQGKDEKINALYDDFRAAFDALGTDPLALGLDNQDEQGQAYLLTLVSQFLSVIKQVATTEEQIKALDKSVSLDSPKNLFALASLGFSMQNWQALNDVVDSIDSSVLSSASAGDMSAFWSRLADWDGLSGDTRIQEKAWFKALIEPVQLSFMALQKSVLGQAQHSWRATMDLLFPSQWQKKSTSLSLASNLKLVLLEAMMTEEAIVIRNPEYKSELKVFHSKLNVYLQELEDVTNVRPGHVAPKNHQIQTAKAAQINIQRLLANDLPMMVMLKNDAVNNTTKQIINEHVTSLWRQTSSATQTVSKAIGGWGGIVAVLNLWNTSAVLQDIGFKMEQASGSHPDINPALREAMYASSYAVSAIAAIFRDGAWSKIIKDEQLLKMSLKEAIKDSTVTQAQLASSFAKYTAVVSVFGLIASGLEAWESWNKFSDPQNDSMENIGYGLKGGAALAQAGVFVVQSGFTVLSRFAPNFISVSTGAVLAPWMISTLMVAGIVYLLAVVIINVFTRSELETWLKQSTWGNDSQGWSPLEEVSQLEHILHRPQMRLDKVLSRAPSQWMDTGSTQWQLSITLPPFTLGRNIGLQITRMPASATYISGAAPAPSPPVLLNEQQGSWRTDKEDNAIYSLTLGGSDTDTVVVAIKMPFNWASSSQALTDEQQNLYYVAHGSQEGALNVSPRSQGSTKEPATRIITVGGKVS